MSKRTIPILNLNLNDEGSIGISTGKIQAFILDFNPGLRNQIRVELRENGIDVTETSSSEKLCVEALEDPNKHYDVLITELNLREANFIEFIRRVRETAVNPNLLIFVTFNSDDHIVLQKNFRVGINGAFCKPLSIANMASQVKQTFTRLKSGQCSKAALYLESKAQYFESRNQFPDALKTYETIFKKYKTDAFTYFRAGRISLNLAEKKRAEKYFNQAISQLESFGKVVNQMMAQYDTLEFRLEDLARFGLKKNAYNFIFTDQTPLGLNFFGKSQTSSIMVLSGSKLIAKNTNALLKSAELGYYESYSRISDALERYQAAHFSHIIIDTNTFNIEEFFKRFSTISGMRQTKIICLFAEIDSQNLHDAYELGIHGHIVLPLQGSDLLNCLHHQQIISAFATKDMKLNAKIFESYNLSKDGYTELALEVAQMGLKIDSKQAILNIIAGVAKSAIDSVASAEKFFSDAIALDGKFAATCENIKKVLLLREKIKPLQDAIAKSAEQSKGFTPPNNARQESDTDSSKTKLIKVVAKSRNKSKPKVEKKKPAESLLPDNLVIKIKKTTELERKNVTFSPDMLSSEAINTLKADEDYTGSTPDLKTANQELVSSDAEAQVSANSISINTALSENQKRAKLLVDQIKTKITNKKLKPNDGDLIELLTFSPDDLRVSGASKELPLFKNLESEGVSPLLPQAMKAFDFPKDIDWGNAKIQNDKLASIAIPLTFQLQSLLPRLACKVSDSGNSFATEKKLLSLFGQSVAKILVTESANNHPMFKQEEIRAAFDLNNLNAKQAELLAVHTIESPFANLLLDRIKGLWKSPEDSPLSSASGAIFAEMLSQAGEVIHKVTDKEFFNMQSFQKSFDELKKTDVFEDPNAGETIEDLMEADEGSLDALFKIINELEKNDNRAMMSRIADKHWSHLLKGSENRLKLAQFFMKKKMHKHAFLVYQDLITKTKLPDDELIEFAKAAYKVHNYKDCIQISRLVSDKKKTAEVYNLIGAALKKSGDASAAIEEYKKGLNVDPKSFKLFFNLSLAYDSIGDKAQASQYLEKAESLRESAA